MVSTASTKRPWLRRHILKAGLGGVVIAALIAGSRFGIARHNGSAGPRTVGVLSHAPVADPAFNGFKAGMTQRGYVEGLDIIYDYQGPISDEAALKAEAQRFVRDRVSLILTLTTRAAQAAQAATTAVTNRRGPPVLFAPASNPVASKLVESLRQPGGLVTGVTFTYQEPRRLDWLRRLVPGLKTVYVPYNPADSSPVASLNSVRDTAARLELGLELAPLGGWEAVQQALSAPLPGVDAIFVLPDPVIASHARELAALARAQRLPLSMPHRGGVEQGALMSYGFDLIALGEQAARLAEMILSGIPPADIPVEIAEFTLAVNITTAMVLGLEVPDTILRQAKVARS